MTIQIKREPTETLMRDIIAKIAVGPNRGKDITKAEAYEATKALLSGETDETHAALFLIGLRMKRESLLEYAGILKALDEFTPKVEIDLPQLNYIAEPYDGYSRGTSVTPYVPAVLAACGLPTIIQGVHSVGPKFGLTAHQTYLTNNMPVNLNLKKASKLLHKNNCGWAYLDQSISCPELFKLGPFRDTIVKRTALTTLERVLMPIKANSNHLALGYVHQAYPKIYGIMANLAGFDKALLIKGLEGGVSPALNKPLRTFFMEKGSLSKKEIDDTPVDLMHLHSGTKTRRSIRLAHISAILKEPNTAKYQMLISTSALILSKAKNIPLNRAVALVKVALESGEAEDRFNNMK